MTLEPSHQATPTNGESMLSAGATPARKTAERESTPTLDSRALAMSSCGLLMHFVRQLWSEKIRREFAGMLPGLGGECEMNSRTLATWCCPSDCDPVALGLSISGTGCSCWRHCPTPTAAGFAIKDVPRMLNRRERVKQATGNGNGFGLTFEQWVAVSCFTPVASDWKGSTGTGSRCNTLAEQLAEMAQSEGETIYPHPEFVEAVMRFPTSWTALEQSETALTQSSPNGSVAD
jgi:hypothetical protein